jgi:epsin
MSLRCEHSHLLFPLPKDQENQQSLTVLDYCLHAGSENVVIYFRDNIYIIKTLKEFQYTDEDGKDQGANVRQKAKDITNLLQDEGRLREERRSRAHMRERMIRGSTSDEQQDFPDVDDEHDRRKNRSNGKRPVRDRDDEELQRAIEESKRAQVQASAEERDLQQAIKLSEEEEAKRHKAVQDSNAAALFDDQNQLLVGRDVIVDHLLTILRLQTTTIKQQSVPDR